MDEKERLCCSKRAAIFFSFVITLSSVRQLEDSVTALRPSASKRCATVYCSAAISRVPDEKRIK
jgi:hypothetical protein